MSKKFIIYGVGEGVASQPYLNKLSELLEKSGSVEFYHWKRRNKFRDHFHKDDERDKTLLNIGKENSKFIFLFYPIWMSIVFFHAIYKLKSCDLIFCSKFESSFPLAFLNLFTNVDYIYLDRDNIAYSYKWPKFLREAFLILESFIGRNSLLHLLPGSSRIYEERENQRVIENTPSQRQLNKAINLDVSHFVENLDDHLIIYINGWLSNTRGFDTILDAINLIPLSKKVKFLFAGSGNVKEIERIKSSEGCRFLGRITSEESLALYYEVDCVVSLFDPCIEIHQRAEPNKWYDCIFTDTPIIVNHEIKASIPFVKHFNFRTVSFKDSKALAKEILTLKKRRLSSNKEVHLQGFQYWDIKLEGILKHVL